MRMVSQTLLIDMVAVVTIIIQAMILTITRIMIAAVIAAVALNILIVLSGRTTGIVANDTGSDDEN